jgi:hypothetical protein
MAKKPFSIRVEPYVSIRFKALSTVLNVDGAKLLQELIEDRAERLSKEEREAYDALLRIWKED